MIIESCVMGEQKEASYIDMKPNLEIIKQERLLNLLQICL